jgi:sRNA-binding protein
MERDMYCQDHRVVIAKLANLFPKTFFEDPRKRVPLKSNIVVDIERLGCADLIGMDVGAAVDFYMSHIGYQICLSTPGKMRVDLDGNLITRVTEQEASVAQDKTYEINQIIKSRRMPNEPIDRSGELTSRIAIVRQEAEANGRRAKQSPAELLASATRKLARATNLIESEDDEFKAGFVEKVLKETKADIDAVLARLEL